MLEIFLRDREIDFEFFVFTNNEFKYTTKKISDVDNQTKELYHSLNNGTIILDGIPITIDNISKEQFEYIYNFIELYKEEYKKIKENYKPRFIYTFGNDIEIPDRRHFKEWAYIKGFEYLQNFLNEYEKQNNKGTKAKRNN